MTGAIVKRLPYLLPLLMFLVLAVYFFVGLGKDPRDIPSVLIDRPVPMFELAPLAGFDRGLALVFAHPVIALVVVLAFWIASPPP